MKSIALVRTNVTPDVSFRPADGVLVMSGECFPENPAIFFTPIFSAIEAHFRASPLRSFEALFRLTYVNSASTKALRRLFGTMNAMAEHGIAVTVVWEYDALDDAAAELGDDLASGLARIDFRPQALREVLAS
jgi:hypothetical protein